jgi:hypothetical protein
MLMNQGSGADGVTFSWISDDLVDMALLREW